MHRQHLERLALTAALAALTTAAACKSSSTPAKPDNENVASTAMSAPITTSPEGANEERPSCGREVNVHGKGYDAAARDCLWTAYTKGTPAGLAITVHTIEGDPITYTIQVRGASALDVAIDNQDRFGARGKRRTTCTKLTKREAPEGRYGFTLSSCAEGPSDITIP